ncbi:hypothetical protein TGPRC2_209210B [Toxoplasma gondii TgCatPRC2]|uniref:Transmembrane protein n=1 Tax=Toxoplasma gondii TgCatPRC2 TaxID=1130821 RepID=A0A151HGV9_TOXGO|nr:hypothetical protein TGPRC2_209210B [Toxoplasma gondii TgCatPRC2]
MHNRKQPCDSDALSPGCSTHPPRVRFLCLFLWFFLICKRRCLGRGMRMADALCLNLRLPRGRNAESRRDIPGREREKLRQWLARARLIHNAKSGEEKSTKGRNEATRTASDALTLFRV